MSKADKYFVTDEENTKTYLEKYDLVEKERNDLINAFIKKWECGTLLTRNGFNREIIYGLGTRIKDEDFCGMSKTPIPERRGIKGDITYIECSDKKESGWYFSYEPDRRYKEGKQLAKEIDELNEKLKSFPKFSTWIINELKAYSEAQEASREPRSLGTHRIFHSRAGVAKEKLVVCMPYNEEDEDDLPKLPDHFHEIKKSEFVALTEE